LLLALWNDSAEYLASRGESAPLSISYAEELAAKREQEEKRKSNEHAK
jgi:hypothetical protein